MKSVYRVHFFPDGHRVVRAYCAFFDYIALANAVTSRQDASQHIITNYLKQGLYGAMYLINKSKRKEQNDMVTTNPDLPRILSLWSILDHKYVQ